MSLSLSILTHKPFYFDADIKVHIGTDITKGLGAGANPEVGKESAEDSRDEIKAALPAPIWSSLRQARAAVPVPVLLG